MFSRLTRAAVPALLIAAVAVAVTLVVSPQARAAVEALLSFNGVNVSVGDDGKLVVTGNTDAVVQQDDYSVAIRGANGCEMAGVAIAPPTTSTFVPSTELATRYPDLVVPQAPDDYRLADQAEVVSDGSLVLTWTNTAGESITYRRDPNKPVSFSVGADDQAVPCNPSGEPAQIPQPVPNLQGAGGASSMGSIQAGDVVTSTVTISAGGDGQAAYVWEADGYIHLLAATDPALTNADLEAMRP